MQNFVQRFGKFRRLAFHTSGEGLFRENYSECLAVSWASPLSLSGSKVLLPNVTGSGLYENLGIRLFLETPTAVDVGPNDVRIVITSLSGTGPFSAPMG